MRSFLLSPDLYNSILKEKESALQVLEDRATKTTTSISGMPSGGGQDRNALLASLADARMDYDYWLYQWHEKHSRVRNFVTEVAILTGVRRCILFQRYVKKKPWAEILPILAEVRREEGREPISERQMYYEHLKALEDCAEWINITGRYLDIGRTVNNDKK